MGLKPEPGNFVDIVLGRYSDYQLVGRFKFTQVDHVNDDYLLHLHDMRREPLSDKFETPTEQEVLDGPSDIY